MEKVYLLVKSENFESIDSPIAVFSTKENAVAALEKYVGKTTQMLKFRCDLKEFSYNIDHTVCKIKNDSQNGWYCIYKVEEMALDNDNFGLFFYDPSDWK